MMYRNPNDANARKAAQMGAAHYSGAQKVVPDRRVAGKPPMPGHTQVTSNSRSPVSLKFDVPRASVGGDVPYVIGRRRVSSPNVLWYGNPKAIRESVTEEMPDEVVQYSNQQSGGVWHGPVDVLVVRTVTTEYTVGYNLDIMLGVCLGPNVALRGIYVDNEPIWQGNANAPRTEITIGENETAFSGVTLVWRNGAFDQAPDPLMAGVADTPGYVGIAYAIIKEVRADKYIGALHFEVERFPNPLALPASRNRRGDDISVATAMYDIMNSDWGGAGIAASSIDMPSLQAAATTLQAEQNYCSVLIDGAESASATLNELQAQIYGVVFQHPSTGRITTKLIRDGAINNSTLNLSEADIMRVRNLSKRGWQDTVERMTGTFIDRADNYEPVDIIVQSVANTALTGRKKRSSSVSYPHICEATSAKSALARDIALTVQPMFSADVEASRKASGVTPGDVIKITSPEYSMYGVPVLVGKTRQQPNKDGTILLSVTQYLLPDNSLTFEPPAAPFDPGVSFEPASPPSAIIQTAPYFLARTVGAASPAASQRTVVPMVFPEPANELQSYWKSAFSNIPNVGRADMPGVANYGTFGSLSAAIDKFTGWTTGVIPTLDIDSVVNPANLRNIGLTGVREGRLLMLVGNELLSFESCANIGPAQWRLTNVRRALVDTVAQDHAQGSRLVIFNNLPDYVLQRAFAYPLSFAPNFRLWSATANKEGRYNDALSASGWAATSSRTLAPPRPHHAMINGARNSAAVELFTHATVNVSWRTRSRTAVNLALQSDAAQPGEQFVNGWQRHRVMIRDADGVDRDCGATVGDTDANSLVAAIPANCAIGLGQLWVRSEIEMPYGVETSVFRDWLPVDIKPGGAILEENGEFYMVGENDQPIAQEAS